MENETATVPARLYKSTHKRIKAACDKANRVRKKGVKLLTIAEYIDRRVEDPKKMNNQ